MTDAENAESSKLVSTTANRLYEDFDSVVILASVVRDGTTYWYCRDRGNAFANTDMARRYLAGEFNPKIEDDED